MNSSQISVAELDGASLPALAAYLRSDQPGVRADAACSIGDRLRSREIHEIDASLREQLEDLLHDPVFEVGFEAAIALAEIKHTAAFDVLWLATHQRTLRLDAVRALGTLGDPRAVAPLNQLLKRWWLPWADRLQVAAALCALGDATGATYLSDRLRSRRAAERAAAIHFLGESHHPQAGTLLLAILADTRDPMRDAAVRALGLLRDCNTRGALQEALREAEGELAQDMREALAKLPSGA